MGDKSAIEWTRGDDGAAGATWNPIRARHRETGKVGWFCIHVSGGCVNCYAEHMNYWRGNGVKYTAPDLKHVEVFLDDKTMRLPYHWRSPRRVFVCSMTDLFGDWVIDVWLDRIFREMIVQQQHTYLILTKRPERMRDYMRSRKPEVGLWPPRWIRLGTSVENQATADERIPPLLQAGGTWVSYEPALAAVDFQKRVDNGTYDWLKGMAYPNAPLHADPPYPLGARLDWIVVGGESGPGARPFDLAWARSTIAQCRAAGVPVFVKQLGARPFDSRPTGFMRTDVRDRKGGDWTEWPEDLRVREYPKNGN